MITSLRPKVRAYFQAGRFIGTDRADAVFALPNAVHVAQAESMKSEVVDALSRHFGRPVGLRLVAEGTPTPPAGTLAPLDEPRAAGSAPPARGAEVAPRGAGATGAARELVAAPATVRPRPAQGRERGHPEPAGGAAVDAEIALEIDGVADLVRSDDLATSVPDTGLSWAEDRLLEAFPGAEEV
ncbi:MAG TPA: hypothetical protein VND23_06270 [Acidimicrobiales bacterium]|nr:hypothetical protein [Acidimicrobiales bacterium]